MEVADGDATSGKTMDACDTTAGDPARSKLPCSHHRSRGPAACPASQSVCLPVTTTLLAGSTQPTRPPHSHESGHGHSLELHPVTAWVRMVAAWVLMVAGVSLIKAGDDTPVTAADFAIQGAPSRPEHVGLQPGCVGLQPGCMGLQPWVRGSAAWVGSRVAARVRGVAACNTYGCRHDLGAAAHGVPQ